MVHVTKIDDYLLFEIQGWHKLWAFENQITVRQEQITIAYQDETEIKFWKGFRCPGTEIPGIITAGTYYQNGKNFWDVCDKSNSIIVELQNHTFKKLFIEVPNPEETLALLQEFHYQT